MFIKRFTKLTFSTDCLLRIWEAQAILFKGISGLKDVNLLLTK